MPVPTVTYRQLCSPFAAPSSNSASAAAFTSVSISPGTFSASVIAFRIGTLRHASFGVLVIEP